MLIHKRAQKLLEAAKGGDRDARVKLDALLKKHHKTEADIPPLRSRGRPRVHDRAILEGVYRERGLPDLTQRTKENLYYFAVGLVTLVDHRPLNPSPKLLKRWAWLLRPDGRNLYPRKTIISQLGRIEDEHARGIFADRLCELKPTAREALRLLRLWEGNRQFLADLGHRGAVPDKKALEAEARLACRETTVP
jgi:hypothetical protein